MPTLQGLPLYIKATILLLGFYLLVSILFIARDLILPFLYAVLLAILISPLVAFLVKRKVNRTLAILSVLLFILSLISILIVFIFSQVSLLSDALPQLTSKFRALIESAVDWASGYFNIPSRKINAWLDTTMADFYSNSGSAIGSTLTTIGGVLATLFLTPVYVFMLLYYQPHITNFSYRLFGAGNGKQVDEIVTETKTLVQGYLVGLFTEFAIIATLNSAGLLLLGINYAILFGILGALLNIIPYVGGLVAVFLFMTIALVTKTPVYVLYVIILYLIIQFADNNYIVPKVVGSKVKLNALVSLLAVIAGASLWGIPGMFLSIPIVAVLKLMFDRIDSMKHWGFLMGEMPVSGRKKGNLSP